MLEVKQLHGGYSGPEVLHDISFTASAGEITAIIGPNGCGKSTLLKTICGILPAASGQVLLQKQSLLALPRNLIAQRVAYLAQNRQTPDITVQRLILHGRFPYLNYPRRYRQEDYAVVDRIMKQLKLSEIADTPLNCLSGGQQQRVYLAMALAQETAVIALDEPTTYLDISHQLQLNRLAKQLAQEGKTVLMVIHDLPNAFTLADRLVVIENGRVAAEGTPEEIFTTGIIDRVFGIHFRRIHTDSGSHYYCEN